MKPRSDSQTSLSLLKRLKVQPADEEAWREFVARYGKKVLGWCRHWGLQEADAADVAQNVLLKLSREITKFEKREDGSFRGWLKTVAHHAWHDLVTSRQHTIARGSEDVRKQFETEEARDDLAKELEAAWDQELMQLASDRVQLRVHPKTWRAFRLSAIELIPGEQVAEKLEMNLPTVYKAKSNVLKMLQAEVQQLEQSEFA